MLSIIFNRGEKDIDNPNYVFSPDTYFKYNYEEEWFDDELVQEMVQDVDASSVMSAHAISSPVLGIIAPERLSGGVKALIIMYKEPSLIVNASACGDNCAKWIVEIAKRKELTINLHHVMDFSAVGAFDALMLNSEQMIHHYNEYLDEAIGIKER